MSYSLLIDNQPPGPELMQAIQHLEVEDNAEMADMLRLRVGIGPADDCIGWSALDDEVFSRLANIRIMVIIGNNPAELLIDSYVIETKVDIANQPGSSVLNVVAMDPTVLMNLEEKERSWPNMSDLDIASEIFKSYGFEARLEEGDTHATPSEDESTTMQRGTDIQFLKWLARRNGYECYVETNPLTGDEEGHFHRPKVDQEPQGVLRVNVGEVSNVNSFSARYDMMKPAQAVARNVDVEAGAEEKANTEEGRSKGLGRQPTLGREKPRKVLVSGTGRSKTAELQRVTDALVDESAFAITADGDLNTAAYGKVLRAKRPVIVCGAGTQFSGRYYVQRVLHMFAGNGHVQRFTLRRNALVGGGEDPCKGYDD